MNNINLKKKWKLAKNNSSTRNLAQKLENGTYVIEKRLSGGGGGGAVYSLKNKTNNRHINYVVKYMNLRTLNGKSKKDKIKEFIREVTIGKQNGIEEIAPRVVLHHADISNGLMFVMTELKMLRNNGVTGQTMASYIRNKCPAPSTGFYVKFKEALEKLYRITGSWHGDMHLNNYYVFTNPAGKVVDIKFIDFGRSRKINTPLNFSKCGLNEILQTVHNKWANSSGGVTHLYRNKPPLPTPPISLKFSSLGTPPPVRFRNRIRRCFGGKCMNNVNAELAAMEAAMTPLLPSPTKSPKVGALRRATSANKAPGSGLRVQRYNVHGPSNSNLQHIHGLNRFRNSNGVSAYNHLMNELRIKTPRV